MQSSSLAEGRRSNFRRSFNRKLARGPKSHDEQSSRSPQEGAPTKEYVRVPADVNYMGILDKKTIESEYTEWAAVSSLKAFPCCASVRSDAERRSKGFKASREEMCDDEVTELAKAESPEVCFGAAQSQRTLIALLMPLGGSAAFMHQSVSKATQRTLSSAYVPLLGEKCLDLNRPW